MWLVELEPRFIRCLQGRELGFDALDKATDKDLSTKYMPKLGQTFLIFVANSSMGLSQIGFLKWFQKT